MSAVGPSPSRFPPSIGSKAESSRDAKWKSICPFLKLEEPLVIFSRRIIPTHNLRHRLAKNVSPRGTRRGKFLPFSAVGALWPVSAVDYFLLTIRAIDWIKSFVSAYAETYLLRQLKKVPGDGTVQPQAHMQCVDPTRLSWTCARSRLQRMFARPAHGTSSASRLSRDRRFPTSLASLLLVPPGHKAPSIGACVCLWPAERWPEHEHPRKLLRKRNGKLNSPRWNAERSSSAAYFRRLFQAPTTGANYYNEAERGATRGCSVWKAGLRVRSGSERFSATIARATGNLGFLFPVQSKDASEACPLRHGALRGTQRHRDAGRPVTFPRGHLCVPQHARRLHHPVLSLTTKGLPQVNCPTLFHSCGALACYCRFFFPFCFLF